MFVTEIREGCLLEHRQCILAEFPAWLVEHWPEMHRRWDITRIIIEPAAPAEGDVHNGWYTAQAFHGDLPVRRGVPQILMRFDGSCPFFAVI